MYYAKLVVPLTAAAMAVENTNNDIACNAQARGFWSASAAAGHGPNSDYDG